MVGSRLCVLVSVFVLGMIPSSDIPSQAATHLSASMVFGDQAPSSRFSIAEKCIIIGGTRVCLEDERGGRRPRENGRRPRERKCPPGYVVLEKPNKYGAFCEEVPQDQQAEQPRERACPPGYVVLEKPNRYGAYCEQAGAPAPAPPAPAPAPAGGAAGSCKPGFVWRNARNGDVVCVTPQERDAAASQNLHALGNRVEVTNNTCKPGLIWRNAWDGDDVCVTPQESDDARRQNRDGPSHTW